ncbi:uncharacterized protein BO88DRAFT_430661 [Aspergillus vadensis CBS 113365]|uniref:Uncharacterized protein n=1 Tax=Aspergillus vadensis (strain CBS 113365 / IMI 142717 / IBT 24658) TaxID=1448311 RepID=A0A319AS83_ASPVC|nr:hypothetical protein BO88DRAFT_430661 [Aspergillus vadensis CBS 113365]PYH63197.1 hypothetical protein BO88DRAFT_430661 [Aspergillus vadensis CBS 113365]
MVGMIKRFPWQIVAYLASGAKTEEKGTNAGWQMAMNSSAYYGVDYGGYCKGGGGGRKGALNDNQSHQSFIILRGFVLEKEIRLAPTNQHDGFTTFRRKIRFWLRQDPGRWGPGQKEEKGKQKKSAGWLAYPVRSEEDPESCWRGWINRNMIVLVVIPTTIHEWKKYLVVLFPEH